MARASLLVAFSLVALAAGADESCSSGAEEAALLQTGNSQGRSITAHGARAGSSCAPPLPGKNNGGSNMGSSPGSGYGGDASSCEQLCGSTGGCQGWTFMQSIQTSTKQCWLKDANLYCPAQDSTDPYNTYTSGFCNGACSSPGPTPSPPSPGPECASPLPGKNNGGSNMGSSPGSGYGGDASGCEQLCGSTDGCQGWTFIQSIQTSTKQCWLKDANLYCPAQDNTDQYNTYTSGFCRGACRSITAHGARAGSSCAPPLPGKNNGGSNMGSSPGSGYGGDASSCEQLCGSTGGCQGWTFMQSTQTSTKQCWLKDANLYCPAQDSTDQYNTYTSGFCNGACSSPGPTPSPPSPGSECASPLPGKNNGGSNMGSSPGSGYGGDASSCEQLCGSTDGCQGWTFIQSTQTSTKQCWLKDANLYCPAQDNTDQYNTYTSGFCRGACR
ncbi:unnamed protein product [Prorocentrum cordatum]|uniref:Apple domain-containing protein n=2 Tax=Prorocentrum cordatum TaxID=2364126 RepID=A0ABN9RK54_9DINO|nr:unnamed protein product [Polarella glacialis]